MNSHCSEGNDEGLGELQMRVLRESRWALASRQRKSRFTVESVDSARARACQSVEMSRRRGSVVHRPRLASGSKGFPFCGQPRTLELDSLLPSPVDPFTRPGPGPPPSLPGAVIIIINPTSPCPQFAIPTYPHMTWHATASRHACDR